MSSIKNLPVFICESPFLFSHGLVAMTRLGCEMKNVGCVCHLQVLCFYSDEGEGVNKRRGEGGLDI